MGWALYALAAAALVAWALLAHGVHSLGWELARGFFLAAALALPPALAWLMRRYASLGEGGPRSGPRWLAPNAGLLALFVGIGIGGLALYQVARSLVIDATGNRLADVVHLEQRLVDSWFHETLEDLQLWMGTPDFVARLQAWRSAGYAASGPQHDDLVEYLKRLSKSEHFVEIGARDAGSGALLLSTTGDADDDGIRGLATTAAKSRRPVFEDIHRDLDRDADPYLGFLVPVMDPGRHQAFEVMHVGIDPARGLFPLLHQWQRPETSAQTLLLRVGDGGLIVMYQSGGGDGSTDFGRVPQAQRHYFGEPISRQAEGPLRGVDERGVPVLAYAAPIGGTPWIVVAKVDQAEVLADVDSIAMFAAALALTLAFGGAWWWLQHQTHQTAHVRHQIARAQLAHRIDFLAKRANDCVLLCDLDGRILDLNDRCLSTYGYAREAYLAPAPQDGRAPVLLLEVPHILQRLDGRGSALFESIHLRGDGSEFPVEVGAQVIEIDGRSCVQVVVRDISERVAAEHRLVALSRLYATISAVNQAIVRSESLDGVFGRVCSACVDHGRFGMAWVGLVDAERSHVSPVTSAGAGRDLVPAAAALPLAEACDPTRIALRDCRACVCNDIAGSDLDERWRRRAQGLGFACAIALPLLRSDAAVGVLTVYGAEVGGFDPASVSLLKEMAENLVFAIVHFEKDGLRREAERASAENLQHLKQVSRRVVQVQEEERRRLAVELHDTAGTSLVAVQFSLARVNRLLQGTNADAAELLREGIDMIADIVTTVREICGELRPPALDYTGLVSALETCAGNFARRTEMQVRFKPDPEIRRLPLEIEAVIYRVAQEALINCAKHARAGTVEMTLNVDAGQVRLTVEDDGVGFDPAALGRKGRKAPGLGLLSMRERTEFIGGRLGIETRPGAGTRITVEVPISETPHPEAATSAGAPAPAAAEVTPQ